MIDPDNIMSMTDFKRDTLRWMRRIRKTGRPGVLTVNGQAEAIVMDVKAYREFMEQIERASVLDAVHRSAKEIDEGLGLPAVETLRAMRPRRKHR